MKTLNLFRPAWFLCFVILHSSIPLHAQNTTFTYQGRVQDNGTNYTGTGQFLFALVTNSAGTTTTLWSNDGTTGAGKFPATTLGVGVTNGLFTLTLGSPNVPGMAALPASVFGQAGVQLEIWFSDGVNGTNAFPLQTLTPAPYATYAATAGVASGFTGLSVQSNPAGAPSLIGGSPINFVGGGVVGATIGGGGATNYNGSSYTNSVTGNFGTVGGGLGNTAGSSYATVAGGYENIASGRSDATVGGGANNTASGIQGATVGGGVNNLASAYDATASGGDNNQANGNYATVPGGLSNVAGGEYSFAAGQQAQATNQGAFVWADSQNAVFGSLTNDSFDVRAQGGVRFVTSGAGLSVDVLNLPAIVNINSGGYPFMHSDLNDNFFAGPFAGNFPANDSGVYNTAIGYTALGSDSVGSVNTAVGSFALGSNTTGSGNTAVGQSALRVNGTGGGNTATGVEALTSNYSGSNNVANGAYALNYMESDNNVVAVGYQALENDAAGENASTLSGNGENTAVGYNTLQADTTGTGNTALGHQALAKNNGSDNTALGDFTLYNNAAGSDNIAVGDFALYSNRGASGNTANGVYALEFNTTGSNNLASGFNSLNANTTGSYNTANGSQALADNTTGSDNTAAGADALQSNTTGTDNVADGPGALSSSTAGSFNTANGSQSLVNLDALSSSGGSENTADGAYALTSLNTGSGNIALGYEAGADLTSGNHNIYIGNPGGFEESGIIRIGSQQVHTATYLSGTVYANGVALTSDRNAKENFEPVDNQAVLARVAALPVTKWNYKTDQKSVQHIGPMAQDFQAAFGLDGPDDKHISVVDEGGVALAAIQGLNQKLQEQMREKDAEIAQLQAKASQVDALQKQLNELAAAVKSLTAKN
jgi:hypothetical protein